MPAPPSGRRRASRPRSLTVLASTPALAVGACPPARRRLLVVRALVAASDACPSRLIRRGLTTRDAAAAGQPSRGRHLRRARPPRRRRAGRPPDRVGRAVGVRAGSCRRTSAPAAPPRRRRRPGPPTSRAARGTRSGRPGRSSGPRRRRSGRDASRTPSSAPSSAARTIDRVWSMFIRSPVPYGPPVQPVLTSQTGTSSRSQPLDQHRRVLARVARHERRPEAGRERRLRLLDPDLGAGQLGGVAADEVVRGLVVASAARSAAAPRTRRRSGGRRASAGRRCPVGSALPMNSSG